MALRIIGKIIGKLIGITAYSSCHLMMSYFITGTSSYIPNIQSKSGISRHIVRPITAVIVCRIIEIVGNPVLRNKHSRTLREVATINSLTLGEVVRIRLVVIGECDISLAITVKDYIAISVIVVVIDIAISDTRHTVCSSIITAGTTGS